MTDCLPQWKRKLVEFAWRRTPGARPLDCVHAKVLRYLIARYEDPRTWNRYASKMPAPAADGRSSGNRGIAGERLASWVVRQPRTSGQLWPTLRQIHDANQMSYAEFGLLDDDAA